MKLEINYKSIVVIGGFNPTILTPPFLSKFCSFSSSHEPEGQTTPVISEIRFGNIHFLMELNKFQIDMQKVSDFGEKYPLDIMTKYLEVLQYTPIKLLGINFNYKLSDFNIQAFVERVKDPFKIEENFGITPISVFLGVKKPNGAGLHISEITMDHQLDGEIKNSIKFIFEPPWVLVNNNFEINGLETDRGRMSIIPARYDALVESNESLVRKLGDL